MLAVGMGHRDASELQLEAGENLETTDNDKQTALQMATEMEFTQHFDGGVESHQGEQNKTVNSSLIAGGGGGGLGSG